MLPLPACEACDVEPDDDELLLGVDMLAVTHRRVVLVGGWCLQGE